MKKTMKVIAMVIALVTVLSFSFAALAETTINTKAETETVAKAAKKNKKNKKNKKSKKAKKAQKAAELAAQIAAEEEAVQVADEATEDEVLIENIEDEETPLAGIDLSKLSIVLKIKNKGALKLGDTLKIEAKLSGFKGIAYSLQWQKSANGRDWVDVKGATGKKLNVVLTTENAACAWRVAAIAA